MSEVETAIDIAANDAYREVQDAERNWPPMNSAYEGYALILEELDELWMFVKVNQKKRTAWDLSQMRKEAIQVAAMAIRFAADICNEERGRR